MITSGGGTDDDNQVPTTDLSNFSIELSLKPEAEDNTPSTSSADYRQGVLR